MSRKELRPFIRLSITLTEPTDSKSFQKTYERPKNASQWVDSIELRDQEHVKYSLCTNRWYWVEYFTNGKTKKTANAPVWVLGICGNPDRPDSESTYIAIIWTVYQSTKPKVKVLKPHFDFLRADCVRGLEQDLPSADGELHTELLDKSPLQLRSQNVRIENNSRPCFTHVEFEDAQGACQSPSLQARRCTSTQMLDPPKPHSLGSVPAKPPKESEPDQTEGFSEDAPCSPTTKLPQTESEIVHREAQHPRKRRKLKDVVPKHFCAKYPPKADRGQLLIHRVDLETLEEEMWLNDTLILLGLLVCVDDMSAEQRRGIHLMEPHFFTTLKDREYMGVATWTKGVDFSKLRYICVPINIGKSHWIGALLRLPSPFADRHQTETARDQPAIIVFDSLFRNNDEVVGPLKSYIVSLMRDKCDTTVRAEDIQVVEMRNIPKQNDHCNCGIHLLGNWRSFTKDPEAFFERATRHDSECDNFNVHWLRDDLLRKLLRLGLGEDEAKRVMDQIGISTEPVYLL